MDAVNKFAVQHDVYVDAVYCCVGEGFTDLPIDNTRVIDMSLGHDAVRHNLLQQVLAIELPEFDSQKLSKSKDVVRLRRELTLQQVRFSLVML